MYYTTFMNLKNCTGRILHLMIEERWMYLDALAFTQIRGFRDLPEGDAIRENMEADNEIRERYLIF